MHPPSADSAGSRREPPAFYSADRRREGESTTPKRTKIKGHRAKSDVFKFYLLFSKKSNVNFILSVINVKLNNSAQIFFYRIVEPLLQFNIAYLYGCNAIF